MLGMAEGFAQGKGHAALVNLHTGPGLGNAMGAMITAWHNKTPLLVTAGQQDRRHSALEPLLTGELVDLAKPYVKRSFEPVRAADVPREIHARLPHRDAATPRPRLRLGPDGRLGRRSRTANRPRRCPPHRPPTPMLYRRFSSILAEARNPAVVAGAGVERAGAFHDAVALAEKLAAPVWRDPISPLAGFPQDHPLFQGHLPPAQNSSRRNALGQRRRARSRRARVPLLPLRPRPDRRRRDAGAPRLGRPRGGGPRRRRRRASSEMLGSRSGASPSCCRRRTAKPPPPRSRHRLRSPEPRCPWST